MIALTALALVSSFGLIQSKPDTWWFKDPAGKPMWSFGVDCVDTGKSWEDWDPANKSYAAHRLYGNGKEWVDHIQTELPSIGVNSLGGWSDIDIFQKYGGKKRLPYFVVLHLGAYDKAPWNDLFAKQMEDAVDGAAKTQITKLKDDPYLVGYFSDNELGWWDDTLFLSYLKMPKGSPGQTKLIQTAKNFYNNDFGKLRKDFTVMARSFAELASKPSMTLKPNANGIQLVHKWNGVLAERYYSLMHRTIRKYDPNRLIMGDRYQQYYNFETAKASRKYIDVASTNYGADWNDGTYSRFFLDSLHELTGKPVIITEFYMGAKENRSGNKNSGNAFPKVETQAERAAAFKNCLETFASKPYVIGAHWFQYADEPEHGRGDGEDWNMGLVDTDGKPYDLMFDAARKANPSEVHRSVKPLPSCTVIPKAPALAMKNLKDWDRTNGWVGGVTRPAHGDLYLCQDNEMVYFGLYAMDYVDKGLYEGGVMPESERCEFKIHAGSLSFSVRYGGDRAPVFTKKFDSTYLSGLKETLIIGVPKADLPKGKFKLSAQAFTHSRGNETKWNTEVSLSR